MTVIVAQLAHGSAKTTPLATTTLRSTPRGNSGGDVRTKLIWIGVVTLFAVAVIVGGGGAGSGAWQKWFVLGFGTFVVGSLVNVVLFYKDTAGGFPTNKGAWIATYVVVAIVFLLIAR